MSDQAFIVTFKSGEVGLFKGFKPEVFVGTDAMKQVAFLQRVPPPTQEPKVDDHPAH